MQVCIRARLLQSAIRAISSIVEKGRLCAYPDRLELAELNEAHTCFVALSIQPSACSKFKVTGEHEIGLSLSAFLRLIQFASADEMITLGYSGKGHLQVHIQGPLRNDNWELKLIQISADHQAFAHAYSNSASLPAFEFSKAMSDLRQVELADGVSIELSSQLIFRLSNDQGKETYTLGQGGLLQALDVEQPCSIQVSFGLLQQLRFDSDLHVLIEVEPGLPLRLSTQRQGLLLQFYIAAEEE